MKQAGNNQMCRTAKKESGLLRVGGRFKRWGGLVWAAVATAKLKALNCSSKGVGGKTSFRGLSCPNHMLRYASAQLYEFPFVTFLIDKGHFYHDDNYVIKFIYTAFLDGEKGKTLFLRWVDWNSSGSACCNNQRHARQRMQKWAMTLSESLLFATPTCTNGPISL